MRPRRQRIHKNQIRDVSVLLGLVFQKTNYLKKADSMEDNFVSFDSKTDSPTRIGQPHSLGGWPAVQENKVGLEITVQSMSTILETPHRVSEPLFSHFLIFFFNSFSNQP